MCADFLDVKLPNAVAAIVVYMIQIYLYRAMFLDQQLHYLLFYLLIN